MNHKIRLRICITYWWMVILLLIFILASLAFSASVEASGNHDPTQVGITSTFLPGGSGRHFYLTNSSYAQNTALTACSSGYHMASLWEILDVTNLVYDYNHPAATTKADSGFGPPSYWYGWVRTGYTSSGSSTTGTGNCQDWSSASGSDYGVAVRLSNTWETAPGDISTWDATSFSCSSAGPVWCVGDFSSLLIPLILK